MTVAAYDTDLELVDDCEDLSGWDEMNGRSSGGAETQEDRAQIQGDYCVSQATGVQTGRTCGLEYDYGSNISWTSGFVFLVWQYWQAPKVIGTWADGGMRFGVASSEQNYNLWNTHGNSYGRNPYGGWANVAVDPEYTPSDEVIGSPVAGNYRHFASCPYILSAVSKGNPHCVDVIRYGRGGLIVEYGESGNYGTFTGMAAANDANTARWGLFSLQFGGFLWKGLMSLGTASNACDFRDANKSIVIDDTPRTYADFNKIEINNSGSRVDWTNIFFAALGTLSKGRFECINDADVNVDSCTFKDMDTFIFQSNSTILGSTFLRCGQVTQGGATFTSCTFNNSPAGTSLLCGNVSLVSNCSFISDGSNHAVQATATGDYNWNGHTLSGYAATDGDTGNEAFYNNSGGHINLTITSGVTPSVRDGSGASTTVIENALVLRIEVKDENQAPVVGAYAYIDNNDESPYILNTTTDAYGIAEITSYTDGPVSGSRWRVRKYGYKPFKQIIDIGTTNITVFVTLVADPQQT